MGQGIIVKILTMSYLTYYLQVAVLDINDVAGRELENTLKDEFGSDRACYIHCDVSDKRQLAGK